ncbi:MAG: hypothetical protein M1825_000689 [Sarcosagium campestre]|nr:MAG: hypothetical protein M1825_000689 [Sarcosagium campestre]
MSKSHLTRLRLETTDMFFHGFDNYMNYAYPEDEIRPISCLPLTRDQTHPDNIGVNDVLGNYSLTLIDTLSTLAILASSPGQLGLDSLRKFQYGVVLLVKNYGDGTDGMDGQGDRARGFDVDSKVQVFETVIRGVGGLLSAHLFANGVLPIWGKPHQSNGRHDAGSSTDQTTRAQIWLGGFEYNGQLLRLAHDLAKRLLPAFHSRTGIPYPRVNLRHGIPFYVNSPLHEDAETGQCAKEKPISEEATETCSAGAGSLVLEFSTLSRLTGDDRFERLAKRAFWEVWNRRSTIGLVGSGIDAESGFWVHPTTGIGAGIDSFFEYALKSHILLSGIDQPTSAAPLTEFWPIPSFAGSNSLDETRPPFGDVELTSDDFLDVWEEAHAAIKYHMHRDLLHSHYVNVNLNTGSPQAFWIDSLGAYYPGLLTLAGELDEASKSHLLYTALWARYSALPERWSTRDKAVEGGLGWWPGRPEFIESTYYLYRATKDPWYLYVGEMVLEDIKRRCWARCGWAGLQDVRSGELTDRMESFFLGETVKYLFLLFDEDHPLNHLDGPLVFNTEGHPLIIPRSEVNVSSTGSKRASPMTATCPKPPTMLPLTLSVTAARGDLFHAASFTRLNLSRQSGGDHASSAAEFVVDHPSRSIDVSSPTNFTFFPWTLPTEMIPDYGSCDRITAKRSMDIQFPTTHANIMAGQQSLLRTADGLMLNSLEGIRLGLILDGPTYLSKDGVGEESFRIANVGNFLLGRGEKLLIKSDTLGNMVDPSFTRLRDAATVDLMIDTGDLPTNSKRREQGHGEDIAGTADESDLSQTKSIHPSSLGEIRGLLNTFLNQFGGKTDTTSGVSQKGKYHRVPAISATGIGAAPLPDVEETLDPIDGSGSSDPEDLPWRTIFFGGSGCQGKLPTTASANHQILVLKRGECSFSEKLSNVPSFAPSHTALNLVIVVSERGEGARPLLDEVQRTPGGLARPYQIPLVMVNGHPGLYDMLKKSRGIGMKRRYHVRSQGIMVSNLHVV